MKIALGVNIDHAATLRNARGTHYPDLIKIAQKSIKAGADSITVHLREDRRHIKDDDVKKLLDSIDVPLNLELSIDPQMLEIACRMKPDFVCLVPEKRQELTTEGGLDILTLQDSLSKAVDKLKKHDIRVSLFVEPYIEDFGIVNDIGADAVELHVGRYARTFDDGKNEYQKELDAIQKAAQKAHEKSLAVHAGHGLHYHNVKEIAGIKNLKELNIGHAIICEALFCGIEQAVQKMKKIIEK